MPDDRIYRALIVDDSPDIRLLTKRALEKEGIVCDEAADGIAAENLLRQRTYAALITDLKMPRKHGYKLAIETLALPNPPVIIVMSGVCEPKISRDLLERGVADYIDKPFNYEILATKVKMLISKRTALLPNRVERGDDVTASLGRTAELLKKELADVTKNFEKTIGNLEKQKKDLEDGLRSSLRVLGNITAQTGQAGSSHAGRVEKMARWLAQEMGMKRHEVDAVANAALLHDIGQFGMPDTVRAKPPWALDKDERILYERYPLIGGMLLAEIKGAGAIVHYIQAHAENYDGTGFPRGLRGHEIPLGGRIIRVADACDTLIMHQNPERPQEAVRQYLTEHTGKLFDPEVARRAVRYGFDRALSAPEEQTQVLSADELREGMTLAENVYDADGRFLVGEGAVVTEHMLGPLRNLLGKQPVRVRIEK